MSTVQGRVDFSSSSSSSVCWWLVFPYWRTWWCLFLRWEFRDVPLVGRMSAFPSPSWRTSKDERKMKNKGKRETGGIGECVGCRWPAPSPRRRDTPIPGGAWLAWPAWPAWLSGSPIATLWPFSDSFRALATTLLGYRLATMHSHHISLRCPWSSRHPCTALGFSFLLWNLVALCIRGTIPFRSFVSRVPFSLCISSTRLLTIGVK